MSKQRHIRKRATSEDGAESPDATSEPELSRSRMEDTKLLQKLRKRNLGLSASTLPLSGQADHDPGTSAGLQVSEHTELMDAYVKAKAVNVEEEDPHMKKFIEDQLAKRLGKRPDESSEDPDRDEGGLGAKRRKAEAELYEVPAELRSNLASKDIIPGMNLTGITEVPLSMTTRMANIEQTEGMKRRILAAGGRKSAAAGPGGDAAFDDDDNPIAPVVAPIKRSMVVPIFGKDRRSGKSQQEKALEKQTKNKVMISERRPLR